MVLENRSEKKQRLLNTAVELFYKNGMAKTTIVQITKKANMGKSTFYEYFKNKEDVINVWVVDMLSNILESTSIDISKFKTQSQKIEYMVEYSCSNEFTNEMFVSTFLEFWRLALNEKNEESSKLLKQFYLEVSEIIELLIEEGIAAKEFKPCDTKITASAIMALIDGLWIQFMVNDNYDIGTYSNITIKTFLDGIRYE